MGLAKQYCRVKPQKKVKAIVAPCEKKQGLCDPEECSFGPFQVCHLCGKSE